MTEFLNGAKVMVMYLAPAAVIMLGSRKLFKIPDELFRKILHFILLGAYIPFLFAFEHWWMAVALAGSMMLMLFPVLSLVQRIPAFSSFVNERKKGEFRSSMVLAISVIIGSITVGWGIADDKYLVLAAVYAWGVGDAFAALVGKRFGKHKIKWKLADSHKSVEGSLAMFITSALSVFIVLTVRGGISLPGVLLISCLAAAGSTVMELCTVNGLDTITCPAVAMAIILPLIKIMGG